MPLQMKKTLIWVFGLLGWVLSYFMFTKWLSANNWEFFRGWAEAFTVHDFNTGFLLDLVAVTVMLIVLAFSDRRRLGPKWTTAVIASLALSVSISLAIYLVGSWRADAREKERAET
ncbi:MAG TPA: hypothetical protein DCE42_21365 [Myxococcales bacterium]|nr:hypothetical protein [Deltaproteobacteria bacterium]MBU53431.1 hypothetical protein [Deltaproteobacteria bacterium]HAA57329.1 hypothetical protein [Myxococcales bacterium]